MDSFEFDNVKAEKEDALWRYNMEKNLSQKQTQKQSDIYDEYVGSRRSIIPTPAVSEEKQIVLAENTVAVTETKRSSAKETTVDKQIVPVENAVAVAETKRSLSLLKQQQRTPPSTTTSLIVTKPKPVITSTDKVKQKEYRRTRSLLTESGNQRPRREFKRLETAMTGRELVVSRTEPPRKSLDEMSNDEFRLIVDNFIAERRKTLIQENCIDCGQELRDLHIIFSEFIGKSTWVF
ncbi:hypothetical protein F3Y22_tig00111393pilonHSYRG00024 [Hibiscus syriacus]|uniref:Uncharacterized protein n=1 Tax=Hibiscus syriacus TaxID=106335 RepID=A0A6A2XVW4_HIBSY|nr:hypothetical protein F3Y22_tig00111393pilonHSYRG00024 [Hibiscus syriacus]